MKPDFFNTGNEGNEFNDVLLVREGLPVGRAQVIASDLFTSGKEKVAKLTSSLCNKIRNAKFARTWREINQQRLEASLEPLYKDFRKAQEGLARTDNKETAKEKAREVRSLEHKLSGNIKKLAEKYGLDFYGTPEITAFFNVISKPRPIKISKNPFTNLSAWYTRQAGHDYYAEWKVRKEIEEGAKEIEHHKKEQEKILSDSHRQTGIKSLMVNFSLWHGDNKKLRLEKKYQKYIDKHAALLEEGNIRQVEYLFDQNGELIDRSKKSISTEATELSNQEGIEPKETPPLTTEEVNLTSKENLDKAHHDYVHVTQPEKYREEKNLDEASHNYTYTTQTVPEGGENKETPPLTTEEVNLTSKENLDKAHHDYVHVTQPEKYREEKNLDEASHNYTYTTQTVPEGGKNKETPPLTTEEVNLTSKENLDKTHHDYVHVTQPENTGKKNLDEADNNPI
ncbi:MAG: hypothetical protein PHF47_02545, partial [Bacilli bacterium]|nr:hypothetical protein [Bacilli bacterium]